MTMRPCASPRRRQAAKVKRSPLWRCRGTALSKNRYDPPSDMLNTVSQSGVPSALAWIHAGGDRVREQSPLISFDQHTRTRRDVWTVPTRGFPDAHFATFPPDLIRPCILAGCMASGVVLDPFLGAGTVGVVCVEEARRYLGIEINPDYVDMAEQRIGQARPKGPRPLSLLDMGMA